MPNNEPGRRRRTVLPLVVMALAGLVLGGQARGEFPKDPAKSYSRHDYVREIYEAGRKELIELYAKSDKKDPKWDKDVAHFFDTAARVYANDAELALYRRADAATAEQALAESQALLDKGCKDLTVRFVHVMMLMRSPKLQQSLPLVREVLKEVLADREHQSPSRVYWSLKVLANLADTPAAERKEDTALAEEYLPRVADGPFINRADRRGTIRSMERELAYFGQEQRTRMFEALAKDAKADTYVRDVLLGQWHVKLAWQARGGGWANQVAPEGWQGFRQHLAKAEQLFVEAYQSDPKCPEAPTEMIAVAMGTKGPAQVRGWFDKAVAAQIDYVPAYDAVYWGLMPRWGGTYEKMLEIGIEAARTERYDTMAPFQLLNALERITEDSQRGGDKWDLWSNDATYGLISEVLTSYGKKLTPEQGSAFFRSYRVAIAWRVGKLEEARKLADELGEKIEPDVFQRVGAPGDLAISQLYGLTGPNKEEVQKAVDLYDRRDVRGARKAFSDLLGQIPKGDKARLYVRDRFVLLDRPVRFAAGEWVSLLPAEDLAGWKPLIGSWVIDKDGALVGTSQRPVGVAAVSGGDAPGLFILASGDFGPRYEIMAKVGRPKGAAAGDAGKSGAGVIYAFNNPGDMQALWISGRKNEVTFRGSPNDQNVYKVELKDVNELHLRLWDGLSTAEVNGQALPSPLPREGADPQAGDVTSAIGLSELGPAEPGAKLRVMELKVRKLTKDPTKGEAEPVK